MSALKVHCFSSALPFPLWNMFLCAHCIRNLEQPLCKMHHSVKMQLPVRHWSSISVLESVTAYFCRWRVMQSTSQPGSGRQGACSDLILRHLCQPRRGRYIAEAPHCHPPMKRVPRNAPEQGSSGGTKSDGGSKDLSTLPLPGITSDSVEHQNLQNILKRHPCFAS